MKELNFLRFYWARSKMFSSPHVLLEFVYYGFWFTDHRCLIIIIGVGLKNIYFSLFSQNRKWYIYIVKQLKLCLNVKSFFLILQIFKTILFQQDPIKLLSVRWSLWRHIQNWIRIVIFWFWKMTKISTFLKLETLIFKTWFKSLN
jgi:hypothetical protein